VMDTTGVEEWAQDAAAALALPALRRRLFGRRAYTAAPGDPVSAGSGDAVVIESPTGGAKGGPGAATAQPGIPTTGAQVEHLQGVGVQASAPTNANNHQKPPTAPTSGSDQQQSKPVRVTRAGSRKRELVDPEEEQRRLVDQARVALSAAGARLGAPKLTSQPTPLNPAPGNALGSSTGSGGSRGSAGAGRGGAGLSTGGSGGLPPLMPLTCDGSSDGCGHGRGIGGGAGGQVGSSTGAGPSSHQMQPEGAQRPMNAGARMEKLDVRPIITLKHR
jgi:hypothetical protein